LHLDGRQALSLAYARLQAARGLIAGGHATQANAELAIAQAFYREVGASAYLVETEALI
jgi:hypothetical protein